jgi:photosystem II stability/assembly factor-like uncharacterized protein/dienelactone hydrolase
MRNLIILLALVFCSTQAFSQALPRKYWNGARVISVNDSIAKIKQCKATGVLITQVVDGGTAQAAKLLSEDVITAVNGITINSREDLSAGQLSTIMDGDNVQYSIIRNGRAMQLSAVAKGRAKETTSGITYEYTSVNYEQGKLGAIISTPQNSKGKLPTILFVQGYTCADMVDIPASHPYKRLCDELTLKGYKVMRVEKPGMGASANTPRCDAIDYPQELKAFDNALKFLKKQNGVDEQNVFVWGHSLGGIIAPKLAIDNPWVKGVMVYGTLAQIWGEYYEKMIREQSKGFGEDPIKIEQRVRAGRDILYLTHVQKKSIAEVAKKFPNLVPHLKEDFGWDGKSEKFSTRSLKYFQTLDEVNTMENWAKVPCKVLCMNGEADIEVLDSVGAKDIVHTVNFYHPNNGIYYNVKQTDHSFAKVGSLADGYIAKSKADYYEIMTSSYNPELGLVSDAWMRSTIDSKLNFNAEVKRSLNPYEWTKQKTDAYRGKQDDIYFTDEQHGWYGNGSGKVYRTTDGGTTWNKVLDKPGFYVRCLAFIDSMHGFVGNVGTDYFPDVTDTTCMLETFDGGITWKEVTNIKGPYPKGLCAIDIYSKLFINAGKPGYKRTIRAAGRVGSPAFMMTSTDNGKTWQSEDMSAHTQMIFDVKFISEQVGFICGGTSAETEKSNALILKTTDGGKTWKKVYTSNRPFELTWKCSFANEKVGFVTIQSYNPDEKITERYVAKTTDGGDTWKEIKLANEFAVRQFGVLFADENLGWVGTTVGGFQTTDGGKNWIKTDFGKYTNKFRIYNTAKGKRAVAIGSEVWHLDLAN